MKKQPVGKEDFIEKERGRRFATELLRWNHYENNRQMPWKGEKDPYRIWLSEIMLQQTRVEQGMKYYQKFITAFPSVEELAAASDEKVFKRWEGLGYYSRCRNLLQAARFIANELQGMFPSTYEDILALKGVGPYTAAAIGSFAYNLPHAVLDGNVFRVLSRIFDMDTPIDSIAGKNAFTKLATSILPSGKPGEYNQAIMDFGATICKPFPRCNDCFFNSHCLAYLNGRQQLLPVKQKKLSLKKRWLNYFIVQCGGEILIQQRTGKDIWHHLHQFFLIETEKAHKPTKLRELFQQQSGISAYNIVREWREKQTLSHQSICFSFFHVCTRRKKKVEGYRWVSISAIQQLAFPRTLQQAVQDLPDNCQGTGR